MTRFGKYVYDDLRSIPTDNFLRSEDGLRIISSGIILYENNKQSAFYSTNQSQVRP